MPVRKAAVKKKRTARLGSARRGSTAKKIRKKTARKKTTQKKTAQKKTTQKKTAQKKTAKKKVSKRKAAKKKTAKKKVSKRKAAKKVLTTKQKPSRKKKQSTKSADAKKRHLAETTTKTRRSSRRKATKAINLLTGPVRGFTPYRPKRGEAYMNDAQLEHFKELLGAWKRELMEEVDRTMLHMKDDAANFPDPNDRATQESEFGLELRTRDRERKLLKKINSALLRIDEKNYGFCEETGDDIGLRRLEARPVATLCVEAQERRELAERQFRDREDRYR